ncbi:hypothetical protein V6R21_12805 [Limibacter armeniacum]|uniref:hypothetical protein n=1 Tax=Limibacter armeniacum TaxID=466084 RepID=UPI002FE55A84
MNKLTLAAFALLITVQSFAISPVKDDTTPPYYHSKESHFDVREKVLELVGNAYIEGSDYKIQAPKIEIDWANNIIKAYTDGTNEKITFNGITVSANTITYAIETKRIKTNEQKESIAQYTPSESK